MQFAEMTGDRGKHHIERDEKGRLMVHGLMTASKYWDKDRGRLKLHCKRNGE